MSNRAAQTNTALMKLSVFAADRVGLGVTVAT